VKIINVFFFINITLMQSIKIKVNVISNIFGVMIVQGVANRGASVRVGRDTEKAGKGYFEDRRPASNMDPYVVTSMIAETTILWKPWATPALCLFLSDGTRNLCAFLSRIWSFIFHLLLFRIWICGNCCGSLCAWSLVGWCNCQGFFIAFHFFPMFSDCYNNIINSHNNIWRCTLMVYNLICELKNAVMITTR